MNRLKLNPKLMKPESTLLGNNERAGYDEGPKQSPHTNFAPDRESWNNLGRSDAGLRVARDPKKSGSVPGETL